LLTDGSIRSQPDRAFVNRAFLLEDDRAKSPFCLVALVCNECPGIGKQFDVKGVARKAIEYARSSRGRAGEWMLQALFC
jgi:hypothetical protein